jgi:hypothetical protein
MQIQMFKWNANSNVQMECKFKCSNGMQIQMFKWNANSNVQMECKNQTSLDMPIYRLVIKPKIRKTS